MKIKVFTPEFDGCIRFSKEELQRLLDEVYAEGYNDGSIHRNYWTYPYLTYLNDNIVTTEGTTPCPPVTNLNDIPTITLDKYKNNLTITDNDYTNNTVNTTQTYQIKFSNE
jgi:hypothetical protein